MVDVLHLLSSYFISLEGAFLHYTYTSVHRGQSVPLREVRRGILCHTDTVQIIWVPLFD